MSIEIPRKRQIELLRMLGEKDPADCAADGPRSLHRHLLLKALWRCVIAEETDRWQKQWVNGDPVELAIRRILAAGAASGDLTLVVRQLQVLALFNAIQVLDNSVHGIEDLQAKIPENVEWRITAFDGVNAVVGAPLGELHGAFLRMDPAGRMGEPPSPRARARRAAPRKSSRPSPKKRTTKQRS